MLPSTPSEVSALLQKARSGEPVVDELVPLVYDELHRMARAQRRRLASHETLNTTAIVNEAYLKLACRDRDDRAPEAWQDRIHFFRVAARVMRDVVVDYARRKQSAKRGAGAPHLSLQDVPALPDIQADEVLALHEALDHLERIDERQARVVELRYFVGLDIEETAQVLEVSATTIKRDWTSARAWLYRTIREGR